METIKSTSYSQHEILKNISILHNGGKPFECDITYSTGNFYISGDTQLEPPVHKFDIAPMDSTVTKIKPWGQLPLEDNSLKSCVFDPPFVIIPRNSLSSKEPTEGSNVILKRFGGYYPVNELLESYTHWLSEMYRVLKDDGIAVVKCQPTVTGGKELNSHMFVWFISECLGFDMMDEYILLSNVRLISGKIKTQQHARKYHSYFFVLKKSTKKKPCYLNYLKDNEINALIDSFVKNNIGKNNGTNCSYREDVVPQPPTMNQAK